MSAPLNTAVALFLFKRPEETARVFAEIALAKPPVLLLIADAPRPDRPGEAELCAQARAVVEQVDWPCTVKRNYAEHNLGCQRRLHSGLDWVFGECEQAIILEDDCLPHPDFFRFCEAMLSRYRDDTRVGHIGGSNLQFGRRRGPESYYYSRYNHVWGWASWRRAWAQYDVSLRQWPALRDGGWLRDLLGDTELVLSWSKIFDDVRAGKVDTWDYQWTYCCWTQNQLAVLPAVNLISNIGYGAGATHTQTAGPYAELPLQALDAELVHPRWMIRDDQADQYTERMHGYRPRTWRKAWSRRLRRWLRGGV